jgi:hypothetical protein
VESRSRIAVPHEKIAAFCRKNHIRKLSLFGSAMRDDFQPESDIDLLVEFEPGHAPGYFQLVEMESELSAMLDRKVDLRTPAELSRYFRNEVIESCEVQYEQK